jgi:hypothetical protein
VETHFLLLVSSSNLFISTMKEVRQSMWDLCFLDSETQALIDGIQSGDKCFANVGGNNSKSSGTLPGNDEEPLIGAFDNGGGSSINNLQDSIVSTEQSCREALEMVDGLLTALSDVSSAYDDVMGQTNSLMVNCENLLEQQVINSLIRFVYSYCIVHAAFFIFTLHLAILRFLCYV